jgi:hypothetical protein
VKLEKLIHFTVLRLSRYEKHSVFL